MTTSASGCPEAHAGLDPAQAPDWLKPLVAGVEGIEASSLSPERVPPTTGGRRAAVLVLFGESESRYGRGPDLLLQQRAENLRNHAGQVSFPGGAAEPGDGDLVHTALREAAEETGLDPAGVVPLAILPELFLPPSRFRVTPVLAHWRDPVAVAPVDPAESAALARVPVAELADPRNRFLVRHLSGWAGPAFEVAGMVVWGFTGGLVDALLRLGGWERPWRPAEVRDLDRVSSLSRRRGGGAPR